MHEAGDDERVEAATIWAIAVAAEAALVAVAFRRRPFGGPARPYFLGFVGLAALTAAAVWVLHEPRPGEDVVLRLEARLRAHPCAAPALRGERIYYFASDGRGRTDRNFVDFNLRGGRRARRLIVGPGGDGKADSMQQRVAGGRYDVRAGRLSIRYCGPNVPEDGD